MQIRNEPRSRSRGFSQHPFRRIPLAAAVARSCAAMLVVGCTSASESGTLPADQGGGAYAYGEPSPYGEPLPYIEAPEGDGTLRATVGSEGGELVGAPDTEFAKVRLVIPRGALSAPVEVAITRADPSMPLPATAVQCGPIFAITPAGLALAVPATLTLPVDQDAVMEQNRFDDEVKVWATKGDVWGQRSQIDSSAGSVTVEIEAFTQVAAGVNPPEAQDQIRFALRANPKFAACLARFPDDRGRQPEVVATVVRGAQNDGLFLRGRNIRPELAFSLFTVERSQLDARGAIDPEFSDFGIAVYQSDFDANARGEVRTAIRTILLDQNFVFDEGAFDPTSTFHVGFWFDDPNDAAACGFDVDRPTPFNEEHEAGPMAMITLPGARTELGPLCTNADTSGRTPRCLIE